MGPPLRSEAARGDSVLSKWRSELDARGLNIVVVRDDIAELHARIRHSRSSQCASCMSMATAAWDSLNQHDKQGLPAATQGITQAAAILASCAAVFAGGAGSHVQHALQDTRGGSAVSVRAQAPIRGGRCKGQPQPDQPAQHKHKRQRLHTGSSSRAAAAEQRQHHVPAPNAGNWMGHLLIPSVGLQGIVRGQLPSAMPMQAGGSNFQDIVRGQLPSAIPTQAGGSNFQQ